MAGVYINSVEKVYPGGVVAVRKANLEIADKEFVVLVEPSGCGKSTFLRMIAGLESITEGKIYIGSQLVNDLSPKDRNIAMVFQNYALYPHMTVRANLAFGLKLRKYPKEEIKKRVKEAADILEISHLLDRKPKQLSGGQRQRVAVGRAIVRHPDVFLFDEPLSNLDAKLRVQMRAEISKLHRKLQATMIYVTHDQTEAMTMGDRIVVMSDGIIHQVDTPLKLYHYPVDKFVAGFIGSPPMNFIEGKIIKQNGRYFFGGEDIHLGVSEKDQEALSYYSGQKVILGIRPEDIHLTLEMKDRAPEFQLKSLVEVVEPMGAEIYTYFKSSGTSFVARLGVRHLIKVGEIRKLVFDMNMAHYFSPQTGRAIGKVSEAG